MGFFTKDTGSLPTLLPVSRDRLEEIFQRMEISYGSNENGELGGYWDDHLFVFSHLGDRGELLQVRGYWRRGVPESERARLLDIVNEVNSERIFPKAYVYVDEGEAVVCGELTVVYEHGATDEQIELHIKAGVGTTLSFFDQLDEAFPEHVECDKARRAAEGED